MSVEPTRSILYLLSDRPSFSEVTQFMTVYKSIGNRNYYMVNFLSEELSYLTFRNESRVWELKSFI